MQDGAVSNTYPQQQSLSDCEQPSQVVPSGSRRLTDDTDAVLLRTIVLRHAYEDTLPLHHALPSIIDEVNDDVDVLHRIVYNGTGQHQGQMDMAYVNLVERMLQDDDIITSVQATDT